MHVHHYHIYLSRPLVRVHLEEVLVLEWVDLRKLLSERFEVRRLYSIGVLVAILQSVMTFLSNLRGVVHTLSVIVEVEYI